MSEEERKQTEHKVFDRLQDKSLTDDVILASVPDQATIVPEEHVFFSS